MRPGGDSFIDELDDELDELKQFGLGENRERVYAAAFIDNATKQNFSPERFSHPKHTSNSAQTQRACNQTNTRQLKQFDLGENRERMHDATLMMLTALFALVI
jgi:hypothetical protein